MHWNAPNELKSAVVAAVVAVVLSYVLTDLLPLAKLNAPVVNNISKSLAANNQERLGTALVSAGVAALTTWLVATYMRSN